MDVQVTGTDGSLGIGLVKHSADGTGSSLAFVKSRGSEGTAIFASVSGTPGGGDVPIKLEFNTTTDGASSTTTQKTILPSGDVGIGQSNPTIKLFVEESGATAASFNRATSTGVIIYFNKRAFHKVLLNMMVLILCIPHSLVAMMPIP